MPNMSISDYIAKNNLKPINQDQGSSLNSNSISEYISSKNISPIGNAIQNQQMNNVNGKIGNLTNIPDYSFGSSLSKNPDLQSVANNPLTKYGGSLGLGLTQGAINTGVSVLNTPSDTINMFGGNSARIPNIDLLKYGPQDPTSRSFGKAGDIAGQVAGGLSGVSGIGKLMNVNAGTPANIRALQGIIGGYATTGVEPDLPYNVPSNRVMGAGLGGLGEIGSQITNKAVVDKVASIYKNNIEKYRKGFSDYFNQTPNEVKQIRDYGVIPQDNLNYSFIKEDLTRPERKVIERYIDNPTFENAHWAQSELGKYVSKLKSSRDRDTGKFLKSRELNAASDAYDSIQSGINNALNEIGGVSGKNYIEPYLKLKSGYESEVVPFHGNLIDEYLNNEVGSRDVANRLINNKPFMEFKMKGDRKIVGPGSQILL